MAYDLFFGKTKKNIGRGLEPSEPMSDEVTITFSEAEKAMLEKISILRMKADSGDKSAQKQLVQFTKNVAKLKAQAKKGDPKAKRSLLVLRESGIFNQPQQFVLLGFSLFTEDSHAKQRRAERFEDEVSKLSTQDQITDLARIVAFNPPLRGQVKTMASKGSVNAVKVLEAAKKYDEGQAVAMRGSSDTQLAQVRSKLQQLQQKSPKTTDDVRLIEQLTERLTRLEAMSGIGYGSYPRNPQIRRARKLARLKARAAAGNQQAIARLQQMQQRLAARAATGDLQATALLQQVQLSTTTTPTTAPPAATTPTLAAYAQTNPAYAPPAATSPYAYPYNTPAYQAPTAQPTYYEDAYGNFIPTNQVPGQAQPTIDVYQGDEEAEALAGDGGATERESLGRIGWYGNSFVGDDMMGSSVVGNAIPHENYRVAVMKAAVKSAGGGKPTTKDFFKAKAAVDQVIGKSGIKIYMPGAQPGRRTI